MDDAFAKLIEPYRRELRAHCYRMSGSILDADDLLQESLLRAWRGLDQFAGRSSLRTWLYSVTTHACIDALEKKSARALPRDLGPANRGPIGAPRDEPIWLEPAPSELSDGGATSPEAKLAGRESIALAFLVALQRLPPKQRAVLILRDVLDWQAAECAELLDLSVAAVNSALQRARDTLAERPSRPRLAVEDPDQAALLRRYLSAWERADVSALVSLLHEDATLAMPPYPEWLEGAAMIARAIEEMVFAPAGPGAFQLVPIDANGQPAFAVYRGGRADGIHVLELEGGRIAAITAFLAPALFRAFGLPETR